VEKPTMNDEISYKELRVVTPTVKGKDEALGIMSREEALSKAKDMGGLDLILINENSDPPVCKIVDYSKWRYMNEKKAKELKKNSKASEVKEVKMSYKIDVHDYGVRLKSAGKFLKAGDRVKCTVMFRGREVQHENLGFELLDKMAVDLEKLCLREGKPKREGRSLSAILSPRPEVLKALNDAKRADEKKKKKEREESLKQRETSLAGGVGAATVAALDEEDDSILNSISMEEDDDDDDDDDGDYDDDLASSLDDLLGGDDLTDDLFG
jgi:translation initiation factor IF-3